MLEDEELCNKCGKPNKKGTRYCIHCGALFESASPQFPTEPTSPISPTTPPTKKQKTKLKAYHKVLIYFAIVAVVNLILSYIIMRGFNLAPTGYFPIFGGVFLLSMLLVGIFWGAGAVGGADAIEGIGYCGAITIGIILAAIMIPVWIFMALAPIVGAIFSAIGQAISDAINNFFSQLFADIEIPGFEPFLFIGLFLVLSIIIIYKFHFKFRTDNK